MTRHTCSGKRRHRTDERVADAQEKKRGVEISPTDPLGKMDKMDFNSHTQNS